MTKVLVENYDRRLFIVINNVVYVDAQIRIEEVGSDITLSGAALDKNKAEIIVRTINSLKKKKP
jgi:hypothetical protein